jgi:hypothetical protein
LCKFWFKISINKPFKNSVISISMYIFNFITYLQMDQHLTILHVINPHDLPLFNNHLLFFDMRFVKDLTSNMREWDCAYSLLWLHN